MTRQEHILKAIAWFWDEHGYSPSLRDIAALTGAGSVSTIQRDLRAMRDADPPRVSFRDHKPRTLKLVEHAETTRT